MEVPTDTCSFDDMSSISIYNCTFENLQHTDCELLINSYIVQWEDDHPHEIRQSTPNVFLAAKTYGDGACGMHAVFGHPSVIDGAWQFITESVRELAVRLMQRLPQMSLSNEFASEMHKSISSELWSFTKPNCQETDLIDAHSIESKLFWEALIITAPELAIEAQSARQEGIRMSQLLNENKRTAIIESRNFFDVMQEEQVVRPLAVRLGYLPSDAVILVENRTLRVSLSSSETSSHSCDGVASAHDEAGYIRGTYRIPFPEDGPQCKYSALFDKRSEFDAIRESFIVQCDPEQQPHTFLKILLEEKDDMPTGL